MSAFSLSSLRSLSSLLKLRHTTTKYRNPMMDPTTGIPSQEITSDGQSSTSNAPIQAPDAKPNTAPRTRYRDRARRERARPLVNINTTPGIVNKTEAATSTIWIVSTVGLPRIRFFLALHKHTTDSHAFLIAPPSHRRYHRSQRSVVPCNAI